MKKIGIIRFPGSNCDHDVMTMVQAKGFGGEFLWHLDQFQFKDYFAFIIPGGFSYGDYLRAGALAARSPVMKSVKEAADHGSPVLGICNGFQILAETHILPGALVKNQSLRFIDDWVEVKIENKPKLWSEKLYQPKARLPIAHGEGRFYAPKDELDKIENQGLVWLRYEKNPNGSMNDIAGVMNKNKNVAALMPHPERAMFDWMGSTDGWGFL
jgi:phosphoribosylformylglycinamidine synthase I